MVKLFCKYLFRLSIILLINIGSIQAFATPLLQLTPDHFAKNDVIYFKYLDKAYYGIMQSSPKHHFSNNDQEYIDSQMALRAKGKLANYLNQKYKQNSTYTLSAFTEGSSCNTKDAFCRIYFIDSDHIKIKENDSQQSNQQNMEDVLLALALENNDNVTILEFKNTYFLISTAQIDLSRLSAKERIAAIQKTDVLTERNLSSFINASSIDVEEILISENSRTQTDVVTTEEYIEKIRESSLGILSKATKLNKIIKNQYISIIYIEIPSPLNLN